MVGPKQLYQNVIEELIPFNKVLNLKLEDIGENFAKIRIPFNPEFIGNPVKKSIHGGVISAAMDVVGGAAGMTTLTNSEDTIATIDLRIDYIQPGQPKDIITEGHIVKSGHRVIFTRMIAYHDDPNDPIAEGRGVYNVRRK